MEILDDSRSDIWIYDWTSDAATRLTFDRSSINPVWTPDGSRIVFASRRGGGPPNLYWQRADGTGDAQRLTDSPNLQEPSSWHPSGGVLAFIERRASAMS